MIDVEFVDKGEIRMGSPYSKYDIKLSGVWIPDVREYDWQDTFAKSPDGKYLVLTAWDMTDNQPGYNFVFIDTVNKSHVKTDTFYGCCTKLEWAGDHLKWEAWSIEGERSGRHELPEGVPKKRRRS